MWGEEATWLNRRDNAAAAPVLFAARRCACGAPVFPGPPLPHAHARTRAPAPMRRLLLNLHYLALCDSEDCDGRRGGERWQEARGGWVGGWVGGGGA